MGHIFLLKVNLSVHIGTTRYLFNNFANQLKHVVVLCIFILPYNNMEKIVFLR